MPWMRQAYWGGYIVIMEKKMETTTVYWGTGPKVPLQGWNSLGFRNQSELHVAHYESVQV